MKKVSVALGVSIVLNVVLLGLLTVGVQQSEDFSSGVIEDQTFSFPHGIVGHSCGITGGMYDAGTGVCDCGGDQAMSFTYQPETGFCVGSDGIPAGEYGGLLQSRDALAAKNYREVTEKNLPEDIHPAQVVKIIDQYALVATPTEGIVFSGLPIDRDWNFRGVLVWDDARGMWKKLLSIEDTNTALSPNNNPVDLRILSGGIETPISEIAQLHVVDAALGAYNEGTGKILVPNDNSLTSWTVKECFQFNGYEARVPGTDLSLQDLKCQSVRISPIE